MIFCTTSNLQHLQKANFWIMDSTFKTVPTLFQQMYMIHALVGGENNSRVFPMVYSLMTSKSKESYERLFQELVNFGKENNQILFSPLIISDFEQAAINAAQIQALGLAVEYGESEDFSIKLCHITALAFLPSSEIPNAFDQVKSLMPPNAIELVQYFEDNYVHGKLVESGYPRMQNTVEGWHQRWGSLIGRAHVGIYTIIDEMRKEQHQTELQIESIICGEERPRQRKL
ncbi:unnamed protein product [Rhizophagus irregularis]|nr:unnamed protein product [Rhizophagus irregularis]